MSGRLMATLISILISLSLCSCQSVCKTFPEWNEWGYENDVEHNSAGKPETGALKLAGQTAEIGVDPACWLGNKFGIVSGNPSRN